MFPALDLRPLPMAPARPAEPPPWASAWWARLTVRGLRAAAEALFPPNELGAPDWQQAEIVPRTLQWLGRLPLRQRVELGLLFAAWELLPLVLGPAPPLSWMSPARRLALLQACRASKLRPKKLLADALKASTSMMYLSHPRALTYIGLRKACANPADPLQVPVEPELLPELHPGGVAEVAR